MEPRPNREEHVRSYVELELELDEPDGIDHVELLIEEFVMGERYEVWDCHTLASGRWWVVGPMLNVYSAEDFKSADYLLSFHIGLMHRMMARQETGVPDEAFNEFAPILRRWRQAADMFEEAEESEDFQSVGMRLRETLVAFAKYVADHATEHTVAGSAAPTRADFVGWSALVAEKVAAGERGKHLRSYLKAISKETWQYVSWLTHAGGAIRADAQVGLQAVDTCWPCSGPRCSDNRVKRPRLLAATAAPTSSNSRRSTTRER